MPLLTAIENMSTYYIERGVDIFKEAISGKKKCLIVL